MNHSTIDTHDRDAPIFAPDAFRLSDEEAALIDKARRFGARVLAPRAAQHDRDATFPIENFRDMHPEGPARHLHRRSSTAALGASLPDLLPRRRRARPLLRRDRAVLEHACLLDAVDRRARRRSRDERGRARRAQRAPRRALPAHRRGRRDLFAAVLRRRRGRRRRASRSAPRRSRSTAASSSTARRSSPRSPAPPTITACSAPSAPRASRRAAATRSISRSRRTRRASAWSATGIRSACAARSRARCC